ncbi:hypothetical protein D3C87_1709880 [compost metagenome]
MNQLSGSGAVSTRLLRLGALKPRRIAALSISGRKVIRQTKSRKVPMAPAMENSRMPWPGVSASEAKLTKVVSMVSAAAGPTSFTVASTALLGSMPSRQ